MPHVITILCVQGHFLVCLLTHNCSTYDLSPGPAPLRFLTFCGQLPLAIARELMTLLGPTGSRLLSADADGQIKCWSMADHLANSWESSVGSLVEGDPIVALSWLHNGVKLALHVEKVSVPPE